jgi:cell filamentation protein
MPQADRGVLPPSTFEPDTCGGMSDDPYLYPGTDVLRNIAGIRDPAALEQFERMAVLQRSREELPDAVDISVAGYRMIHRHLFQDVYDWAGQDRTVNISKGEHTFCLAPYIGVHLQQRFAAIASENGLKNLSTPQFAARAAHHICELNAVHPFREGNGRVQRLFLKFLTAQAGHCLNLQYIRPEAWLEASKESFGTGDCRLMQAIIADAIIT